MPIQSHNPTTAETVATFPELTPKQVSQKLEVAQKAFGEWRQLSFGERRQHMLNLAAHIRMERDKYAVLATLEMGKTLEEAKAELDKSAASLEMYANETERMLADEPVESEFRQAFVRFEPMGVILAVMPWNFPFWQVLRFVGPALMGGNVAVLKHASNVPQCAVALERMCEAAGLPRGVFQTLLIGSAQVEAIIRDPRVAAVTLTGSEAAGRQVAKVAGEEIKPVVLELGGSDAFVVLKDADLDLTVKNAVLSRLRNNGQSCIAAKRFVVEAEIYEEFLTRFQAAFEAVQVGDPALSETLLGPVASAQALADLERQVEAVLAAGGKLVTGGQRHAGVKGKGYFFAPTIIRDLPRSTDIYREEIFGPVALVFKANSADEVIEIANDSDFGLGGSVWTEDEQRGLEVAGQLATGSVYINKMMTSDARFPFGGVKRSGIGRELSRYGLLEFQNIKSIILA